MTSARSNARRSTAILDLAVPFGRVSRDDDLVAGAHRQPVGVREGVFQRGRPRRRDASRLADLSRHHHPSALVFDDLEVDLGIDEVVPREQLGHALGRLAHGQPAKRDVADQGSDAPPSGPITTCCVSLGSPLTEIWILSSAPSR